MSNYLIYGAYGYTGTLIAEEAVRRGQRPVLAGRNREAIEALGKRLDLPSRVLALEPDALDKALRDVDAVVHCAGPFVHTSRTMAESCLRTKTHYLDITGEPAVFEELATLDQNARSEGVLLLPGIGFDVVPTDCLAAHLKARLPSATRLCLGMQVTGSFSRGTSIAMIENLGSGGLVRKDGELKQVPNCWKNRTIDFGFGPAKTTTVAWGDVSTAYYSTGIGDIEVYLAIPFSARFMLKSMDMMSGILMSGPVQRFLKKRARKGRAGPTAEQRASYYSRLWGQVSDDQGASATSLLSTAGGYTCTTMTALAIIERVLADDAPCGFQTPSKAYGSDFILEIEGVERKDVDGNP